MVKCHLVREALLEPLSLLYVLLHSFKAPCIFLSKYLSAVIIYVLFDTVASPPLDWEPLEGRDAPVLRVYPQPPAQFIFNT